MNIELWQLIVAAISAIGGSSLLALLLQRYWHKKDLKESKSDEMMALLKELKEETKSIRAELSRHIEADDERNAVQCRVRIQRFNDEILHGEKHTKEHFDQILQDCTTYERYCGSHPNFPNNVTYAAVGNIKNTYNKCMMEHDFL